MQKTQENELVLLDKVNNEIANFDKIRQNVQEITKKIINFASDLFNKNKGKLTKFDNTSSFTEGYLQYGLYTFLVRVWDCKDCSDEKTILFDFPILNIDETISINTKIHNHYLSKHFKDNFSYNLEKIFEERIMSEVSYVFTEEEKVDLYSAFYADVHDLGEIPYILNNFEKTKTYAFIKKYEGQLSTIVRAFMVFYYNAYRLSSKYVLIDSWSESEKW